MHKWCRQVMCVKNANCCMLIFLGLRHTWYIQNFIQCLSKTVAAMVTESEWIEIQQKTFLNWVNQTLSAAGTSIDDLQSGFVTGTQLVRLVECLQDRKLKPCMKPLSQHHQLENINMALQALVEDKVRLVNIGAEDIVKENMKLILGLVWHMILKYQIGKSSKVPPKKVLLAWIQAVIPTLKITNFTNDWNSGIALHALLDYCEPGTSPYWQNLERSNGLANCRSAMILAKSKFDIPQIMSPEDMNSTHLDELSAMTYLSYYMKTNSPGHRATLAWVNSMVGPQGRPKVTNFTTEWTNGELLCDLLTAMGTPPSLENNSPRHRIDRCYKVALQKFNIEPVLSPDEMTQQDVDHIGVMAYAARLQNACPTPVSSSKILHFAETVQVHEEVPKPSVVLKTSSPMPNQPVVYMVDIPEGVKDKSLVTVQVEGPLNTKPQPSLSWKSDTKLEVSFTPLSHGEHYLQANGIDIEPLSVEVARGRMQDVHLELPKGLHSSRVSEVRLDCRCLGGGEVRAELKSPSGRVTDVPVKELGHGLYDLRILANEPGDWLLFVWVDGDEIQGSPFHLHLLETKTPEVVMPSQFVLNKASVISLENCYDEELSVRLLLNSEELPCYVEEVNDSKRIRLLTSRPGNYTLEIIYGGEHLRGSPFKFVISEPVVKSIVKVTTINSMVQTNKEAFFVVHAANAGPGDLVVNIIDPRGNSIPSRVNIKNDEGEFVVHFVPIFAGVHNITIEYAGSQIKGSPFTVTAYDPDQLRITFEDKAIIAQTAHVKVDLSKAGNAPVELKVVPPSESHLAVRESRKGDIVDFQYVPSEIGYHKLHFFFNGQEVPDSPFRQMSQSAEIATAHGEGLVSAHLGKPVYFFVDPKGQKGDLFVQVDGPTSISSCHIEPTSDGLYRVSYTPKEVGHYSVQVKWNGESIPGSPFSTVVLDLYAIRCTHGGPDNDHSDIIHDLRVDKPHRIAFDTSLAGPARLSSEVKGPRGVVPVNHKGDSFTFTPNQPGEYTVKAWFGDLPIPGTPYCGQALHQKSSVADHTKVILSGRGLKEARVKEESAFMIDGSQAGKGRPAVHLVSINNEYDVDVLVRKIADDKYKCTYTPFHSGSYLLNINWAERPLRGSPFKVTVLALSESNRVVCSGDGLRQGIIGQEIKSIIDTRRAGPGELTSRCSGPTKVAYCELYDHQDGTFTLNIRPQEAGKHVLTVEYNGEQVQGSPFSLRVSEAPDASRVRVYGPGVEHGVLDTYQSRFICETKGAGAGQLTVRIRGPKGAFRVEMEREYQKDRTIICRYDPTENGDYQLHVKWSGEHVPGSPFHVHIFRTDDEMNDFLANNPGQRMNGSAWNADI